MFLHVAAGHFGDLLPNKGLLGAAQGAACGQYSSTVHCTPIQCRRMTGAWCVGRWRHETPFSVNSGVQSRWHNPPIYTAFW